MSDQPPALISPPSLASESGGRRERQRWGKRALVCAPLLAILILATCAAPISPTPSPDPFAALLETGDTLAADGSRTAAEEAYRQAAAARPDDPIPYQRLAQLYLDWNRPHEGVTELELAERLGAPAAQITPLRAALEAALGNWEEVVGWSQAALALDPDGTDTRGLLARAYVAQGSLEEAQAQYRALLDENPDDIRAQERLGILLALTDPPAAPPYLRSAETPLASALIAALESVGDGDPAYRLALVGQACLAHDEPSLAASALERAVGRRQNYADGHALLGQALDRLARQEEALLHLEEAVRLAPNSSLARSLLGLHHLQAGEPGAARPHLEVAYDLDSDNPLLCLYLARTYADLGQYDAAEVWLKEATRLAPENPAIREAAVRFYLRLGLVHEQQGLEAAQAFVELEPESAVAHDLLGWVHFLAGDAEQAAEHLSEAVELGPSLATAHYHLGRVEAYLGRREEAQLTLTRALDLNTDPALRAEIERALSMLR